MGFLDKITSKITKQCAVCGGKTGFFDLDSLDLVEGPLCGKCRKKCSPFLSGMKVQGKWSVEDVKNHMASLEEQKTRLQNEFTETDCVLNSASGEKAGEKLLSVDRTHGWFTVKDTGEIFEISRITGFKVCIETKDDEDSDVHLRTIEAPRPNMIVPGHLETLRAISVEIALKDHPYANYAEVSIATSGGRILESYHSFLVNVYNTAAEIYDLLEACTGIHPGE